MTCSAAVMTFPGPSIPIRVEPVTPAVDPRPEPLPERERPAPAVPPAEPQKVPA